MCFKMDLFHCLAFMSQVLLGYCLTYKNKWNQLTEFPTDIPADVTYINVQGNNISYIKSAQFNHILYLVSLKVTDNIFTEVPDLGTAKAKLEDLYMDENRISKITTSHMTGYKSLTRLVLKRNLITEFPDLGDAKNTLKELNLESNFIRYTNRDMFLGFEHLSSLELKDNLLLEFPDLHYIKNKNFSLLSVNLNEITHFYPWVTRPLNLSIVDTIKIKGNSLICDCRCIDFAKYVKLYATMMSFITCDSPAPMKGLKVEAQVNVDQLVCEGLENNRVKAVTMKRVTSHYVHYPPVVRRVVVPNLFTCIATCMQTNGCYYIIVTKETGLCDITSIWQESGLVFNDEDQYNWEVYTIF